MAQLQRMEFPRKQVIDSRFNQKQQQGTSMFSSNGRGMSSMFNILNSKPPQVQLHKVDKFENLDYDNINGTTDLTGYN